jgi:hypothetical protein
MGKVSREGAQSSEQRADDLIALPRQQLERLPRPLPFYVAKTAAEEPLDSP